MKYLNGIVKRCLELVLATILSYVSVLFIVSVILTFRDNEMLVNISTFALGILLGIYPCHLIYINRHNFIKGRVKYLFIAEWPPRA